MNEPVSSSRLLKIWLSIGLQSFGGGVATFALIRKVAVDQYHWVTEEEFSLEWGMVQLAPGINLLALTILLGRRVRGASGILVALAGLLLPSAAITVLITAGYTRIRNVGEVQAALNGALPAIVALGAIVSVQMLAPLFHAAHRQGPTSTSVCAAIMVSSAIIAWYSAMPVAGILLFAGTVSALANVLFSQKSLGEQPR